MCRRVLVTSQGLLSDTFRPQNKLNHHYFFFHKSTQRIVARMPSIFQERGVYQGLCLEWILQNHAHENRENRKSSSVTKHVLLADEFLYRIGLVGHPFFRCDEMRLRWVFTVKTLSSCCSEKYLRIHVYTGRAGGSS